MKMACLDFGEPELRRLAREDRAADAMYSLGIMYSTGQGVPLDYVQAHKWFNLAAMMGNGEARQWRGQLAAEMNQTDIAEAQKQARAWIYKGKPASSESQA
jgi:TPR repeat protein